MLKYRRIDTADDEAITKIVRTNLERLNLNIPGTAYFDPERDHLSAYYNSMPAKRCYFIALDKASPV